MLKQKIMENRKNPQDKPGTKYQENYDVKML